MEARDRVRWAGLVGGPLLALAVFTLVPSDASADAQGAAALGTAGRATLALMTWMATWWLTEAIDIAATALMPVVVLPLFTVQEHGGATAAIGAAAEPYADHFIALFLGGFLLALAMERWGLHRRLALLTLRLVGTRPMSMLAGFMGCTALLSMWVSNTATTVTMLPIALSVTALVAAPAARGQGGQAEPGSDHLALCLMLGIAYAASIGGIGTLIGTPPNLLLAGFLEAEYGRQISFARWLGVGLPLVAVFVPLTWFLLGRVIYPVPRAPIAGGQALVRREYQRLGPMSAGEWATAIVFLGTATCWLTRPLLARLTIGSHAPLAGLTDAGIAVTAALLLFVIPVDVRRRRFVLDWDTARKVPWGILILFGGGLSLAAAVSRFGVADFLGHQARGLDALPQVLIVLLVAAGVIFLTELTSNTATTAALLPILAGVAPILGLDPIMLLVPAAIAASCAFMMPVATPPNAIVFGSGLVTIPQMCRAGLWLNLIGIALVTGLAYTVVRWVL